MASREGGALPWGASWEPSLAVPVRGWSRGRRARSSVGLDPTDPRPLWISGTVLSRVRSQLPVAGVGKASLPRLTQPAAPLQSPEEPGERRGWQKPLLGRGRMRGASQVQ